MTSDETQTATYKQIEASLRSRIGTGQWREGAMLPSRRDLAREYGVSPVTIERAIAPLVHDGLLRADDRRGTFVSGSALPPIVPEIPVVPASTELNRAVVGPVMPLSETSARRTCTVGVVASLYLDRHDHLELNNRWVASMVESVERRLAQDGHHTRFINRIRDSRQPPLALVACIAEALAARVDGLVIIGFGFPTQEIDDALAVLDGSQLPVVCITSGPLRRPVPHVFFDNRSGGYEAAQRLLASGCREVTFFSPFTAVWVDARSEGAADAVNMAGSGTCKLSALPESRSPWQQEEDPREAGYAAATACFERGWHPDGVICVSDGVAFGLLAAAEQQGLRAGEDFALIGFDDHPDARQSNLTSVRPPMDALGQEAARLLARALAGSHSDLQVRLRGQLILRSSSAITPK